MDFLDDMFDKAKEVFDVASKKTNEVVTTQKQKFDISSLESKKAKDFAVLGEIYYNKIKSGELQNEAISELIAEIDEKLAKIAELKKEINNTKNKSICPACGANIDKDSKYCNACGEKLFFDSEEN